MILFRRVSGESMVPRLYPGQWVVCGESRSYSVYDVVVVRCDDKEIIKSITAINGDQVWLEGSNTSASTDSRDFGWVDKSAILGRMKFAFPRAVPAPTLRDRRGGVLGFVAAVIMICFALVHLFRIDTFVPELAHVFGGNRTMTAWIGSLIVIMEVFAIPFLLRIRLSRLAQYCSGLFAVAVPLVWLLIAIWSAGTGVSTAQLGEFLALPSNWLLIAANLVWLLFSYYTIWALGYDYKPGEKQTFVTRWLSRLSK